ncbi:MAG: NAD kinase [Candidatus Paracaedibacteraceae bacterium]|nr:NAD kinase [Candidatus Paracaedibacteraceae bacterium]
MKIAFITANKIKARRTLDLLEQRYTNYAPEDADFLAVLGGDGFMLKALRDYHYLCKPFYGMNLGNLGFLMNSIHEEGDEDIEALIHEAKPLHLYPLEMKTVDIWDVEKTIIAFNDVSVTRASPQAAKLKIFVNDIVRVPKLIADGILVSTPAGSTAYNSSAGGPILPVQANLLALTPISPFRPKNWKGALLKNSDNVVIETLESKKRPVNAVADMVEIKRVVKVSVHQKHSLSATVLFSPHSHLEERIIAEQF